MDNFEQIRSHVADADYHVTMQQPYVICVEISLRNHTRQQAVYLSELHDDDGKGYLRVSTVIARAEQADARRALAFNWQSRVGYLALSDLDDGVWLQLCENRPYAGLSAAELDRLILEIGGLGDQLEHAMAGDTADLL